MQKTPNRLKNYVNGEFVDAKKTQYISNYEPATGHVLAEIPDSEAVDVVMAVQAANRAFSSWSALLPAERAVYLSRIADLLERDKEKLALAECEDVGKPLWLAREVDIPRTILNFRHFAARIVTDQSAFISSPNIKNLEQYTKRVPYGVTGLIAPWNMPLYTLTFKLAPSLAVGNTAVCKPSNFSPMTAYLLAEILQEAGLPAGVCNIIFGSGEKAGQPLVQHPGVPLLSFTGSTTTGKKLLELAAPSFKKLSLELGGKNANIILNDADLAKAIPMAVKAAFLNSGQICLSGSRLLIQQDIYKEFMAEFLKQVRAVVVGDPKELTTFMGPVISLEQKEKVLKAIEQAKKEEGKIVVGGSVPEDLPERLSGGYFVQPTVIEDLTNCSELWQEEIFGPVVTTMSFKYPHDAVKWANTSPFGLSASIWTDDLNRGHKMAGQIEAGTVWVNTWAARDVAIPFGGEKASGVGHEGGEESLRTYAKLRTVAIQL